MVLGLGTDKAAGRIRLLNRRIRMLQTVDFHVGLDHAERYNGSLSADVQHFTHTGLSLDLHDASLFDRS